MFTLLFQSLGDHISNELPVLCDPNQETSPAGLEMDSL